MALRNQEIAAIFRHQAKHYDLTAQLYYLAGFRVWAYRKKAVKALALKRGDTVVELGCGTGLNFRLLEQEIGPEGTLIGVDLTDSMLGVAQERVRQHGWSNVELVHADWADFPFPRSVHGILSTFALLLVPEEEPVIRAGAEALLPGGRFVVLSFKSPNVWLSRFVPVFAWLSMATQGWTLHPHSHPVAELVQHSVSRYPWEELESALAQVSVTELYGGFAYLAVGERDREGHEPPAPLEHRAP